MSGELEGQVALVTGASRGIGRAVALELARAGAKVALNYRRGEAEARAVLEEVAALGGEVARVRGGAAVRATPVADKAMLVPADVGKSEEARDMVGKVVAHWGRLDILVNNAGITKDRTLRKLTDEDWLAVINNNLNSVFYCTSAAAPVMIQQNYGRIINISSLIAQTGAIGQANYGAAKGGTIAFTKTAALELAKYNVTVNAVVPGYTATDMFADVPAEIQAQIKARIPLGRFAQPEEIARVVRFLAAEGAYITGQQINVNGGLYM